MDRGTGFDVEAIRAAHPLADFFRARGVPLRAGNSGILQGKCPFHHEQNGAALAVWPGENRWQCFGKCQAHGDVIDALMRLDSVDFKEACERLGGSRPETSATAAREKPNGAALSADQVAMKEAAMKALATDRARCGRIGQRRGWQAATIGALAMDGHLGIHDGRLAFIYGHGLKLRWQAGGERRIAWAFGGNSELWRADRLEGGDVRRVIVCEGETDAIALLDTGTEDDGGAAVVAIPGASCWKPEWTAALAGRDALVATDADEAGEKAARRIMAALSGTAATVARLNPLDLLPGDQRAGAKDIGDVHERLGRDGLRAALNTAIQAAQESAKSEECPTIEGDIADSSDFESGESVENEADEAAAPFPIHCLPGMAGEMAREAARAALVPEVLTAMNVLGILSAAIGAGLEAASGGNRRTRGNLFLMPVAKSGTGKGQSFGEIARPYLDLEAERIEEWRRIDRPRARTEKAMAEARLAKLTGDARKGQTPQEKETTLREMSECHADIDAAERGLNEPAWSTEQATKEAIENLFRIAPRETLASLSAEARGAVDVLMGRYRESTDESIFLAGYSGDPVKIHRKGSSPVVLARPCLTVLWALQPDKLRELLESGPMSESGLLPRFLFADTKAEPMEEPEEWEGIAESVKQGWAELVRTLIEDYHEAATGARVILPDREAASLFREYQRENARRRKSGGDLEDVDIFAARWAENAWRLAVVLHAAEHGEDAWRESLTVATAARAVELARWFADQQLRILAAGREDRMQKRLDRLRETLELKPDGRCNLSELERRHGLTAGEVQRLADQFPAVVVVEKMTTGGAGRPPVVARLLPKTKTK